MVKKWLVDAKVKLRQLPAVIGALVNPVSSADSISAMQEYGELRQVMDL